MGIFYGNVALGGGGLLLVDALPTANATEYNKNNIYLYNGNLYIIKYDNGTYAYEMISNKVEQYQVTFTASNSWYSYGDGIIEIYDGQDDTGTLLLKQLPAKKSAYPMTLTIESGYCFIKIVATYMDMAEITSSDYTTITDLISSTYTTATFQIDKNGTIDIGVYDFDL